MRKKMRFFKNMRQKAELLTGDSSFVIDTWINCIDSYCIRLKIRLFSINNQIIDNKYK